MTHPYSELVIGGVLVTPFVTYAAAAALGLVVLRPLFRIARFERLFANPPIAMLGLYVVILAALIVFV